MPIRITKYQDGKPHEEVARLCDGDWHLPMQIYVLEEWLKENHQKLNNGPYVTDIGFGISPNAAGGGGALTVDAMEMLVSLDMEIWLSEYPVSDEDEV